MAEGVAVGLNEVQMNRSCLDVAEEYRDQVCKSLSTSRAKIQFSKQKPFLGKSVFPVLCRWILLKPPSTKY